MKVLHVITSINRGGAQNHLVDLIQGQIDAYGCQIACAYLKGDGYWSNGLKQLGASVIPLGLGRYGEIKPLLRLRTALRGFQPDLVHAHLGPAELYTRMALIGNARLPLIISQHNEDRFYPGPGYTVLERWVVKRARCIIAISHSVGKSCAAHWPDHLSQRLQVIHHGINPAPYRAVPAEKVAALRRAWGAGSNTLLVGAVARMVPEKAIDSLIDGFAVFTSANSESNAKLVLVGDGPLEPQLKRQVEERGLGARVVWAGFREDIPVVMQALDLFVLSSTSEGFGLVLLEAMSTGKPVIASAVSAIPEIVINEVTGILIPPRSPQALADALSFLAANPEIGKRYGEAGRLRVEQSFQLGDMLHKTMECYQRVLCNQW